MQLEWLTLEEYQLTYESVRGRGRGVGETSTSHSYTARLFPSIALCLILSAYIRRTYTSTEVCQARLPHLGVEDASLVDLFVLTSFYSRL
jgi:hypothetical protein